jgi:hypothetical protein
MKKKQGLGCDDYAVEAIGGGLFSSWNSAERRSAIRLD